MMDFEGERSFGDLLARYRTEAGKSQQSLADCLGVHRSTIVKWEQRGILPKDRTRIEEIVQCLNLRDSHRESLFKAALLPLPHLIQNLPYLRNPFFTGRDQELEQIHAQLQQKQTAAIGQIQSISGLGGIGKTQLAVEYTHRYNEVYQYVLWVRADTTEELKSSYYELAHLLNLPEKGAKEQEKIIQAVKRWLQRQHGWLLILDNADSPALLPAFLPLTIGGHLLITTRATDMSSHLAGLTHPVVLDTFSNEQGALFLLHRANLLPMDATLEQAEKQTRHAAMNISHELGGLPLALDQAGAYIYNAQCSLEVYQQIYQRCRIQLLTRPGGVYHPEPVATTWDISFQAVEQRNPAAADLLRLCAYLSPDAIPEEVITESRNELGNMLAPLSSDMFLLNKAIEDLRAYSLVTRDPNTHAFTIHRLVQAILRDSMNSETQRQWMERVVPAIENAWIALYFASESAIVALMPHVLECATWVKQCPNLSTTVALLLLNIGDQLKMNPMSSNHRYWELLYETALMVFEEQKPFSDSTISYLGLHLTTLYFGLERLEEAENVLLREIGLLQKEFGKEHLHKKRRDIEYRLLELVALLNERVEFYRENGMLEEAKHVGGHVLKLCEDQLGKNHPTTKERLLDYLEVLSEIYTQGDLDKNEDKGTVKHESS